MPKYPDFGKRPDGDQRTRDLLSYFRSPDPPHDLAQYADPGGYLIEYCDKWGNSLCADCADLVIEVMTEAIGDDPILIPVVREAGATFTCDECEEEKK